MNVPTWFKRKRPRHSTSDERYAADAHTPILSPEDVHVTLHWGYTPAQWAALDNSIRTNKRSDYFKAVGLG